MIEHAEIQLNVLTVTGDHSFKQGCFTIQIQYLTTALGRILFSSVVQVLAFRPGVPGSNPTKYYISGMYLFICFFVTFVKRPILACTHCPG